MIGLFNVLFFINNLFLTTTNNSSVYFTNECSLVSASINKINFVLLPGKTLYEAEVDFLTTVLTLDIEVNSNEAVFDYEKTVDFLINEELLSVFCTYEEQMVEYQFLIKRMEDLDSEITILESLVNYMEETTTFYNFGLLSLLFYLIYKCIFIELIIVRNKKICINSIIMIFVIMFSITIALFINLLVGSVKISGYSMMPTLVNSEHYLVNKMVREFKTYDIVAFKLENGKKMVKRVIATQGQSIYIKEGLVYVDNVLLEEDYLYSDSSTYLDLEEIIIGENMVFVLGDNRDSSLDSRSFGPINKSQIIGLVKEKK